VDKHKIYGKGSDGTVVRGELLTGRGVHALKFLDDEAMQAEVEALQKLSSPGHDHVIRLLGVYQSDFGTCVVALPVAECNLHRFLEARARIVTTSVARSFATQLASGLAYMHNALVMHRDLKPSNVLMTVGDTGLASLWIADMGRARVMPAKAPRRCPDKTVVNDSRVGVDLQFPNMTPGQRRGKSIAIPCNVLAEPLRCIGHVRAMFLPLILPCSCPAIASARACHEHCKDMARA
jgi:serine/threonine protein kinase